MGWPCPTCDRELTTERGMRQHHTKVHGVPLPNRTCKGCGTAFHDTKAGRSYCDDCNPNAGEHNGNWRGGRETATCQLCGAEFRFYPSEKKGVYCPTCVEESDEFLGTPYHEVHEIERIDRECDHCGEEMSVLQTDRKRGRGRFCSHECLCLWMSKDGATSYNRGWFRPRRSALERDDYTCQECGKSATELGQSPDVHHIRPVRLFEDPEDAHHLGNLISLCRSCHTHIEWRSARYED
ncbi:MAG: HNH endonuclease signature motif containing protein [Halobacteriales archaeon]|nr:HNH endonuclease signature motif containing protein [Halobacteriales archaeon]